MADEVKEQYRQRLADIERMKLGWLVEQARSAITPIMEQEQWNGLEIFDPLIEVAERLLNTFGIYTRIQDGGLYVDIPMTGWHDF